MPLQLRKFMMAINADVYRMLETEAEERGVSVQEFFRAVILPEWVKRNFPQPLQEPKEKRPVKVNITEG